MNRENLKKAGLFSAIAGSLVVGLPAMTSSATAQTANPCPGIYYSAPFDRIAIAPQGCPPNFASQQGMQRGIPQMGMTPISSTYRQPIVSPSNEVRTVPSPQMRSEPITQVPVPQGNVDVKLINNTNARISYEAIAYTQDRILPGGQSVTLQNLPAPVTVTLVREDGGFLDVMPVTTTQNGMLVLTLDEAENFDDNQGVIRVQQDGQVFLN